MTDSRASNFKPFTVNVWDILFLVLIAVYVFAGYQLVPFHGDESTFIALSRDYEALTHGEFRSVLYDPAAQHDIYQSTRLTTGFISAFSIGFARNIAGIRVDEIPDPWDWNPAVRWEDILQRGLLPSNIVLYVSRLPSTIFTILSSIVIFFIARLLTPQRATSWLSGAIFAANPVVLVNGRRAMQEGGLLLCVSLILFMILLYQNQKRKVIESKWLKTNYFFAILGMLGGIAVSVKHTTSITFATALLIIVVLELRPGLEQPQPTWRAVLTVLSLVVGSGLLAVCVFFFLAPVFWMWLPHVVLLGAVAWILLNPSIIEKLFIAQQRIFLLAVIIAVGALLVALTALWETFNIIIQSRIDYMNVQSGGETLSLVKRLYVMGTAVFYPTVQYYEVWIWTNYPQLIEQINTYQQSLLAGYRGNLFSAGLLTVLAGLGALRLLISNDKNDVIVILLSIAVPALVLLAVNSLPWQRYYLILFIPIYVLIGLGFESLVRGLHRILTPLSS